MPDPITRCSVSDPIEHARIRYHFPPKKQAIKWLEKYVSLMESSRPSAARKLSQIVRILMPYLFQFVQESMIDGCFFSFSFLFWFLEFFFGFFSGSLSLQRSRDVGFLDSSADWPSPSKDFMIPILLLFRFQVRILQYWVFFWDLGTIWSILLPDANEMRSKWNHEGLLVFYLEFLDLIS